MFFAAGFNSSAFMLMFLAFTAMMGVVPFLLRRFRIPGVIALLTVGMLTGPHALNLIPRLAGWLGFLGADPETVAGNFEATVRALGSLGLIFLMALAGMEADFRMINSVRAPVIRLSIATFLIPAAAGFVIYYCFRPADFPGQLLYASLFASHSVGIVFPVMRELKLSHSRFGAAVLISTVITDIASIVLLAVSVQLKRMRTSAVIAGLSLLDRLDPSWLGIWFTPLFLLTVLAYILAAVWLVQRWGIRLFRRFSPTEDLLVTLLLLVILLTVLAGELLGVNPVVGAFVAGLALSRLMHGRKPGKFNSGPLIQRLEGIGYGLLVPFLFVSIGMDSDFRAFGKADDWAVVAATVTGLVLSKMLSGYFAMRSCGFSFRQCTCAGLMTVPQLSATLAAAAIGKNLGMLDGNFFNAIIVLSIVTTLPVPLLVRWIIGNRQEEFMAAGETAPYRLPERTEEDELL